MKRVCRIVSLKILKNYCDKNNIVLKSYNQSLKIIEKFKLGNYASKHKAFTFPFEGKHYLMYRDNIDYHEKLKCICHELGHIYYGHTTTNDMDIIEGDEGEEMIADEFEKKSLLPNKILKIIAISLIPILSIILTIFTSDNNIFNQQNNTPVIKEINDETSITSCDETNTVYVTTTGSKYHLYDCYHIQNTIVIELNLKKAREIYKPCKDCMPELQHYL